MRRPSRRTVLSTLYAGTVIPFAGCTTELDESNDMNETDTTAEDDETEPPSTNFPRETTSEACPPFDDANRVVCYEAVDPEESPLVLVPETQSVQPNQPTKFTLRNQSEQRFNTSLYHWRLYKRVDGNWHYIVPESWRLPITALRAGEDHAWTVTVPADRVSDGNPIERVRGTESLTIAGLGGGHYAFGVDGWFTSDSSDERTALAAGFEVNADPLELTVTEYIEETEWDGETVVARSTRGDPIDDDDQPDTFILERIDSSDPDTNRVIAEQVVRNGQLRDTITLSRKFDADRVRLEEFSDSIPPFGIRDDRTYEYQGTRYRVTTREG